MALKGVVLDKNTKTDTMPPTTCEMRTSACTFLERVRHNIYLRFENVFRCALRVALRDVHLINTYVQTRTQAQKRSSNIVRTNTTKCMYREKKRASMRNKANKRRLITYRTSPTKQPTTTICILYGHTRARPRQTPWHNRNPPSKRGCGR